MPGEPSGSRRRKSSRWSWRSASHPSRIFVPFQYRTNVAIEQRHDLIDVHRGVRCLSPPNEVFWRNHVSGLRLVVDAHHRGPLRLRPHPVLPLGADPAISGIPVPRTAFDPVLGRLRRPRVDPSVGRRLAHAVVNGVGASPRTAQRASPRLSAVRAPRGPTRSAGGSARQGLRGYR